MEIEIRNLCKTYGTKLVLDNICMNIPEGMYGLLGENGSGKTTLMRILATVLEPSSGSLRIDGTDLRMKRKIRQVIGYLPQDFSVYPSMRVEAAMDYLGVLSEIPRSVRRERTDFLLKRLNLDTERRKRFKDLSGGMKQRFGIAQALLNDPKFLIIDEPTAGLDPEERNRFYDILTELAEHRSILISTHIASDVEAVCARAAVLSAGRLIFQGSIQELVESGGGSNLEESYLNMIRRFREGGAGR